MNLRNQPITATERASRDEIRRANREREDREIEACKAHLAERHRLERNDKFEIAWRIAWRIAWENGHSSGLSEVESYFDDLAELLKP